MARSTERGMGMAENKGSSKVDDYDDDEELTSTELTGFRDKLMDEAKRVHDRLQRHSDSVTEAEGTLPDEVDQASREAEKTYLLKLADKERKLLVQINRALGKFDQGTYGICEGTGDFIRRKRLELRPWTRYSIHHKELLESQKKRR